MSNKKWIRIFLIFATFGILFVGAINYIVDPYGMNNFILLNKINKYKKSNTSYTFRFKTNIIRNHQFNTLMLGTSRIGVMDPNIVNKYTKGHTFNFSVPDSVTEQQYELFLYALKYNKIKYLIYGIDFYSFNKNTSIKHDFEAYYKLQKKILKKEKISNYDLYFSLETFENTIIVLANNALNRKIFEPRYLSQNGMRDYMDYAEALKNGKLELDSNIINSMKRYFKSKTGELKKYKFSYKYLEYFKKIIDYCNRNNIKVIVYIPPMYSDTFDAINSAGYFKNFELFQKEIVKSTNFIDFTGHNTITENKNNYWDGLHLRKNVTKFIMGRLFNDTSIKIPSDFGTLVTKKNIDKHLKDLEKQRKHFNLKKVMNYKGQ